MSYFDWHRNRLILLFFIAVIASISLFGCGGGGAVNTPPPNPDFSLAVQSSASVTQGSSTNVTVTLTGTNGFSGQVSVTVSGFTSGLSATPSQFVLTSGGQQVVTLAASSTATVGTASLTVAGQSGSLNHSAPISCAVNQATVLVPDFSMSIQPSSITVPQGSSALVTISATSLNNFSGLVNVTISGFGTGLSANQTQFSILCPGGQQIVSISAAATAPTGSINISVTGQSGTLSHSTPITGSVTPVQIVTHPSLRTNYIRDDAIWDSGFLSFFPQNWILYHPGTKRFFVSNTTLNRVEVYDATTETKIGQITVPAPFVGDFSLDKKSIYMGTQMGDLYVIDPVAITVTKRYPNIEIGPNGFPTYEIRALADGRFALLGGQGGLPEVDGWNLVGIWNPTDNSIQQYSPGIPAGTISTVPTPICPGMGNIGEFSLSADQTKILLGGTGGSTLCSFDPVSGKSKTAGTFGIRTLMTPPDGKEIIIPFHSTVTVYDSTGLFQTDQFTVGDGSTFYTYFLSTDGNTLYVGPRGIGVDQILAYDWRTHQLKGWVPTIETIVDFVSWVTPMAMDETGLMLGVASRGLAFLDGGTLMTSGTGTSQINGFISPNVGPTQGGTNVQATGLINSALANGVFFGSTPATGVTPNPPNIVNAVSPPGAPGPVNITVTTPSNLQLIPESFSYGPWAVEAPASGATAEGGGISTVFGYGFGPTGPTSLPANLTAKLGGQTVPILNYAPIAIVPNTYPFPLQSFDFTVPAGTPGATADLTLTDDYGSATVSKSIQFLPALQRFPLPGSVLIQGIYDPRRDVYYFTDQNAVQVFSKTLGKWLSPINLPHAVAPAINRLWGISLSPDGSKLAISDAGTTLIYMVDPDTPGSVKTFVTPSAVASDTALPGGLAITDSGIIYYSTFYLNTTGNWAFHKLDTTTGTVSDYHTLQDGAVSDDAAIRVLLSNDNTRAFMNLEGVVVTLDTATDVMSFNFLIPQGDFELSLSSNQTWMTGTEYVMDTNLNAESRLVLNERETYNVTGVYGEKVSPDGNLLFSPLLNALDVFDGRTGVLRMRISLSIALSTNYDALVSDGKDNILVAITGQKGDGGVSVIDLSSLPEPPTSVFSSASNSNLVPITVPVPANGLKNSQPFFSVGDAAVPRPQKSTVNRVLQNVLVPHSHQ